MNNKNTDVLQNELKKAEDVASFIKNNAKLMRPMSVSDYLTKMMIQYDVEKNVLIARSSFSQSYAYQIMDGRKNASRDKLIQMALCFPLTLEETNTLLECGGYNALYVRCKRDVIIQFAIQKKYSLMETNNLLLQNEEELL